MKATQVCIGADCRSSWPATGTGTVTSVTTAGAPITIGGTAADPTVGITQATTSTSGYLSSTDWNTFNGKLGAVAGTALASANIWVGSSGGTAAAVAASGDVTLSNTGVFGVTKIQGNAIASGTLVGGDAGKVLRWTGSQYQAAPVSVTDLRSSTTGTASFPAACAAGSTLTYNSVGDSMACTTISITKSQISDLGTIGTAAAANTGTASGNVPVLDGSGKLASGVLPSGLATQWTTTGSNIYYSTGNVGIGTSAPNNALSFGGDAARSIAMERSTTATANPLTLSAGGTVAGASNGNGGALILQSGMATGSGGSSMEFRTATPGTSGNADVVPSTKVTILGSGNVGIGTSSPNTALDLNGAFSVRGLASAPALAPTDEGRIYFDSAADVFKVSQNGGAYVNLVTSGGSGGGQASTSALTYTSNSDGTGTDGGFNFVSNATTLLTIANNGDTVYNSTTASTSSTTGAVKVSGGLGVAGSIYSGASVGATTSFISPLYTSATGSTLSVYPGAATTATSAGNTALLRGGAGGTTSGDAGSVTVQGGVPSAGNGGNANITATAGVGTNKNGGNVVLTAGAATGSGTAGSIQLTGGNVGIGTGSPTASLDIAGGTVTGSSPLLKMSQTWNNAAATFNGLLFNVTNTASSLASSSLFDFQVDGASRLRLSGQGLVVSTGIQSSGTTIDWEGPGIIQIWQPTGAFKLGNGDTVLARDSTGVFAMRDGTSAHQLNIYNTYTSATNYEGAEIGWKTNANAFTIQTTKGSGGGTTRNIAMMGGNVGVGTTSPSEKLTVSGSNASNWQLIEMTDANAASQKAGLSIQTYDTAVSNSFSDLELVNVKNVKGGTNAAVSSGAWLGRINFWGSNGTGGTNEGAAIVSDAAANFTGTSGAANLNFQTTAAGATFPSTRMTLTSTGNLNLGTTSTTHRLAVGANSTSDAVRVENSNSAGYSSVNFSSDKHTVGFGESAAGLTHLRGVGFAWVAAGIDYRIANDSAALLTVKNAGQVGIGTISPTSTLQVAGSFTVSPSSQNLTVDNTLISVTAISFLSLTSNNATPANRTFCLGPGTIGQRLIIANATNNDFELTEALAASQPCGAGSASVDLNSTTLAWAAADEVHEFVFTANSVWRLLY